MSREYFEALAEEQRRAAEEQRRDQHVCAWSFFIALLPARVQEHFGEEYGYDAVRWVKISSGRCSFCRRQETPFPATA